MNLQEAFNKIYIHAQKKEKAFDLKTNKCMYRTSDGKKCFAGCLIPDELYDPIIEGRSFSCSRHDDPGATIETKDSIDKVIEIRRALDISDDDSRKIFGLQRIHDSNEVSVARWNEKLEKFAVKYALTIPTI